MYTKLMCLLGRFRADRSGVTAIEYGVIAAAIVIAIVVIIGAVGTQLNTTFNSVNNALTP